MALKLTGMVNLQVFLAQKRVSSIYFSKYPEY